MGLFGFGNKNRAKSQATNQGTEWQQVQNRGSNQEAGWQQVQDAQFAGNMAYKAPELRGGVVGGGEMPKDEAERREQLNNERRRRKIAAVLLVGAQGQGPEQRRRMGEIINTHDVGVDETQYNRAIDLMASGVVGRKQAQEMIASIQRPADRDGAETVFRRMSTVDEQGGNAEEVKHMRRILGNFSDTGFQGYRETSAESVKTFLRRFPDAMSFDAASEGFLEAIHNRNNPPEKIRSYYEAMNKFKGLMYGNEQKYLEQFKVMEVQAVERRNQRAQRTNEDWAVLAKPARRETSSDREALQRRAEMERQREQLVKGSAERQVSKATVRQQGGQVSRGDIFRNANLERENSEDACLSLPEQGVFAVFDGAGGVQNGRAASRMARDAFLKGRPNEVKNATQLARMMEAMNGAVQETGGITTGIVAKVNKHANGRKYLSYASVGDSRLYVLHKNGQIELGTSDEGFRNRVWNMLGMTKNDVESARWNMGVSDTEHICLQHRDVWLEDGDRVILCSDGISGDNPPEPEKGRKGDLLSNQEIARLASAPTAEQAAENLLLGAKKIDDRSAVVFDV